MGPSGSGKSTLRNVLGALDRPDAGRYRPGTDQVGELDDPAAASLGNRSIGIAFQLPPDRARNYAPQIAALCPNQPLLAAVLH